MYDPSIGRWRQEDPIRWGGGDVNLGRYVGNGPTNRKDPSGLMLVGNPGILHPILDGLKAQRDKFAGMGGGSSNPNANPTAVSFFLDTWGGSGGAGVTINTSTVKGWYGDILNTYVKVEDSFWVRGPNSITKTIMTYAPVSNYALSDGSTVVKINAPPGTYKVGITVMGSITNMYTSDYAEYEVLDPTNVIQKTYPSSAFPFNLVNVIDPTMLTYMAPTLIGALSLPGNVPTQYVSTTNTYDITVTVPRNTPTQMILIVAPFAEVNFKNVEIRWSTWVSYWKKLP